MTNQLITISMLKNFSVDIHGRRSRIEESVGSGRDVVTKLRGARLFVHER